MNLPSGKYLLWLSIAYLVCMGLIAVTLAFILRHNRPDLSVEELVLFAGKAFIWPLQIPVALIGIWYLGALVMFLFWKWAQLLKWITGLPIGTRVGQSFANDRFLRRAPRSGPYGMLHRKVSQNHPMVQAGEPNG